MFGPRSLEKNMRIALAIALACVVIVAPLIGVYALSPFFFVWGLEPYQLAVAVAVMVAEALTLTALVFLVGRKR
ncbi:MAG: hypothetical protein B7Y90_13640 [Alphaproteobacteria bacterium 32-64-14]|nr:MAG: hypothetical protein B7Y90_13640 [Alphaproteobacteria bacterium 32-64-14]